MAAVVEVSHNTSVRDQRWVGVISGLSHHHATLDLLSIYIYLCNLCNLPLISPTYILASLSTYPLEYMCPEYLSTGHYDACH